MNKALAIFFAILLVLLSIGSVIAIPSPGSEPQIRTLAFPLESIRKPVLLMFLYLRQRWTNTKTAALKNVRYILL
jgi:predicted small integral membrane protein